LFEIYVDASMVNKTFGIGVIGFVYDKKILEIKRKVKNNLRNNNEAELYAILLAVRKMQKYKNKKIIIYSDSLNSLNLIKGVANSKNDVPFLKEIQGISNNYPYLFFSYIESKRNPAHKVAQESLYIKKDYTKFEKTKIEKTIIKHDEENLNTKSLYFKSSEEIKVSDLSYLPKEFFDIDYLFLN